MVAVIRPNLFAQSPESVPLARPKGEHTWLVDLNKDGKQDVLVHYPSATESHRVTLLVAK